MDETLAEIALTKGTFKVVRRQGQPIGLLSIGTSIGQLQATFALSPTLDAPRYEAGRVAAPIDIAPFDFAASAVNWVMQDAVASGVTYAGQVAANESSAVHSAIHILLKAALGDTECRLMMADLSALSNAHSGVEFNQIQSAILARCGACQNPMGSMTPEQVRRMATTYARAYQLMASALPWLTENVNKLLTQLAHGHIDAAKTDLSKRFVHGYGTDAKAMQPAAEVAPIEHYTTSGAPINIGKFRACVGCKCDNPCENGCSCGCGCEA